MTWLVLLLVAGSLAALWLLAARRGLTRGRAGRLLRVGHLSARLSASFLGARLRRLFARGERRARVDELHRKADAERVARTMGEMKGALMKLGQMVSFVSDDIPAEYRAALASLQAQAPPLDFPLVRDVVERELGEPLERAFAHFDTRPLAAASIGQVHRARLPSGDEVVVKVQYPGVAEAIASDLKNAAVLYRFVALMYPALDPKPVVEELRSRITEELDYVREAANQQRFVERFDGHPSIHVPRVFHDHCRPHVLTTQFVDGKPFADAVAAPPALRARYAETIYRFVFSSILGNGMFNGDPHPGNYLFHDDGSVTFLDFGCVKYFPRAMLGDWKQLVLSYIDGKPQRFREQLVRLGFMKMDSPLTTEKLMRYFSFFWQPFTEDREFEFTREYNARSLGMVFAPGGEFEGLTKQLNMPADFVFVNRIQWGVYSILGQLGARQNFHRIHREYLALPLPDTIAPPALGA